MTMLHTPQDVFVAGSAGQSHHSPSRSSQIPRNHIYSQIGTVGYRGASSAPVTPYAFQSTPNLRPDLNKGLPSEPIAQHAVGTRLRPSASVAPASASFTAALSSSSNLSSNYFTKDDSTLGHAGRRHSDFSDRPASSVDVSASTHEFASTPDGQAKAGPERYRRRRSENNLQVSKAQQVGRSVSPAGSAEKATDAAGKSPAYVHQRTSSADDNQIVYVNKVELAKRYRRRSAASLENMSPAAAESTKTRYEKPAASAVEPLPKVDAGPVGAPTSQAAYASHRRTTSGESSSSRTGQRSSSVSSAFPVNPFRDFN